MYIDTEVTRLVAQHRAWVVWDLEHYTVDEIAEEIEMAEGCSIDTAREVVARIADGL